MSAAAHQVRARENDDPAAGLRGHDGRLLPVGS
jgi:hypothetical protein